MVSWKIRILHITLWFLCFLSYFMPWAGVGSGIFMPWINAGSEVFTGWDFVFPFSITYLIGLLLGLFAVVKQSKFLNIVSGVLMILGVVGAIIGIAQGAFVSDPYCDKMFGKWGLALASIASTIYTLTGIAMITSEKMPPERKHLKSALIYLIFAVVLAGAVVLLMDMGTEWGLSFALRSISIADRCGFPSVMISFDAKEYPIYFRLLTPDGAEIFHYHVASPRKVIYMPIEEQNKHRLLYRTNIVGPRKYLVEINLIYSGEILSREIEIKGARADIRVLNVRVERSSHLICNSISCPVISEVDVEVKNDGDVPLYFETLKLLLDGKEVPFYITKGRASLNPGESEILYLKPIEIPANEAHVIEILIPEVTSISYKFEP
ncbi:hypothetical protein D6D85_08365 [Candidatus Methanodesulfokora washburnensis]|jgi:archaellum component FlaF (FlaF/FlaG flagellin family)|uniref:Uncharacterized protein n=1 Tax=Candidatus Methanodesulfokora washburnensis TaxID=2478471 RepID=A0A3R9PIC5_9CREN|nr:hypothetical protein D6D85_08365 [Candidatus Methanodesulfokores washburnensis]